MPPPHDGNTKLPFVDLMRLDKIDDTTFRSTALSFMPGGSVGVQRSYGGHVYAQAAWAACQTVSKGFLIHNVSGNFILGGIPAIPYIYKVLIIRDGRSYKTRIVTAVQDKSKGICFTCTISFKTSEPNLLDSQKQVDLWDKYSVVLAGKKPANFPDCPSMDVPFYLQRRRETGINDDFPGLESPKPDMSAYNASRSPLERRQLIFYRAIGEIPLDEPNLHLCAHLYASDRNSLYHVANHFDVGDVWTQMGSLVHATVFHSPIEELLFRPSFREEGREEMHDGEGRWFVKEDYATRLADGRGMFNSRMWNADGKHIATLMQDGMIRYTKKAQPTEDELKVLAERKKGWKPAVKL
ncbi:Hypothetical protein R9X50_00225900 [Acrodontium crateriforme]|uniref:Thioesterase/thiol ester dehydrase-isomerase n=1 Tax=Acrodontium crateriforme TaxID=150365 RepID=A0AAQ3R8F1_9PEZI|nr:Hypothetical protein R9X50_00225900 [Acrodontium crateriforme]